MNKERRASRVFRFWPVLLWTVAASAAGPAAAQSSSDSLNTDQIPIERCDRLPVVKVHVGETELRFLLDTGATTMLNMKSFVAGKMKQIAVTSWSGTAATSAREISLPELRLGTHSLKDLKLPAIDLSPIGSACGGPVDGILGFDVLEKMGVTLDLKRKIASLEGPPPDAKTAFDDMETQMGACTIHFEKGHTGNSGNVWIRKSCSTRRMASFTAATKSSLTWIRRISPMHRTCDMP